MISSIHSTGSDLNLIFTISIISNNTVIPIVLSSKLQAVTNLDTGYQKFNRQVADELYAKALLSLERF